MKKKKIFSLFSLLLLAVVATLGGYFVTSERDFDERGRAGEMEVQDSFGGLYTKYVDGGCRYENIFTGDCSCPENFQSASIFDFITTLHPDIYPKGGIRRYYCFPEDNLFNLDSTKHIFGGMYSDNADGSCRHRNAFTKGCSCPSGFDRVQVLEFLNPTCRLNFYDDGERTTNCGFREYYCVSGLTLWDSDFGGVHTENVDGSCRYVNYLGTSADPNQPRDCSCPNGFKSVKIHDFESSECDWYGDGGSRSVCGVYQYYCVASSDRDGRDRELLAIDFRAEPDSVSGGESFSLFWGVLGEGEISCMASSKPEDANWKGEKEPFGSSVIENLSETAIYTLTCSDDYVEDVSESVTVTMLKDDEKSCNVDADCSNEIPPYEICFDGSCLRGDVNNDGMIDMKSFSLFMDDFIFYKNNGWDPALKRSDFNEDGRISMADYSIFVYSYRKLRGL